MIADIAKYQGVIDWDALAPELDFVVIKASGKEPDPYCQRNLTKAAAHGVPVHVYHFLYCTTVKRARVEAQMFADAVGSFTPLFWVLDCEKASGITAAKARSIVETFEDELRRLRGPDIRVAVYIAHELYKSWALDYGRYAYVWIPRYGKNTGTIEGSTKPNYPCDLWQYTSKGRLPGIDGVVDLSTLNGDKPLSFFTGSPVVPQSGGDAPVAINYDKYINSTGTHYISNSGQDENKRYSGGKAGDQTGHEWELKAWYSRPWTVVLRWPDAAVARKMAELGCAAALNDKIGYDQYQRTTYWTQLKKAGYDPAKITTACEEDCTAGVTANCKAVGCLMDIQGLKDLAIDTYSGNMKSRFIKAGFKALTDSKYLTSSKYLLPGDVLLYENHHAAMNVTTGAKVRGQSTADTVPVIPSEAEGSSPGLSKGDHGSAVTAMQKLLLKWNPGCLPKYGADGDFGSETVKAVKAFQTYRGLPATGVYDETTRGALIAFTNSVELGTDEPTAGELFDEMVANVAKTVRITGGSVNVRAGNSLTAAVLGVVHEGDTLPYQGITTADGERNWLLVEYENQNGWVSDRYAEVV